MWSPMESDMAKQKQPEPAKTEKEQAIELLKKQIKRMEEKGLTDTCHHEMLRRALSSLEPQEPEEQNPKG